jgi:hypothetical protein
MVRQTPCLCLSGVFACLSARVVHDPADALSVRQGCSPVCLSGVFMVRQTPWSRDFMERVYNRHTGIYRVQGGLYGQVRLQAFFCLSVRPSGCLSVCLFIRPPHPGRPLQRASPCSPVLVSVCPAAHPPACLATYLSKHSLNRPTDRPTDRPPDRPTD